MSEQDDNKKSKGSKYKKSCLSCLKFLYDKNDHTVFGRTGKSWFLIFVFYVIFFSLLAGFFSLLLYIFLTVFIKVEMPYRTGDNSLLKSQAGLNVNPRLTIEDALIIISSNISDEQSQKYQKSVNLLFEKSFDELTNNATTCVSDSDQPNDVNNFCKYMKNDLGPCMDPLGQMKQMKLCIFLRINKVFGWLPDISNVSRTQNILVDCEGQNPGDVVNMNQPQYFPSFNDGTKSYGVIPNKYFPFINQKGYVSPMVAIQFPGMKLNTAILVQCQIKNLRNAFKNVKFEIMVLNRLR